MELINLAPAPIARQSNRWREILRGQFKVRSLESISTLPQDFDVGVVRVSGGFLRNYAKRNSLVRISILNNLGRPVKSITRIVRAATGIKALHKDEIALQYDDRIELGIRKSGTTHLLEIQPISGWLGVPKFLLGHASPLVRLETAFAISLMIIGAVIGFLVGVAI